MTTDSRVLGSKAVRKALAAERKEIREAEAEKRPARAPLDSALEGRFVMLLKEAQVPPWERPSTAANAFAMAVGAGHRPDFMWKLCRPAGERHRRLNLAVFIDGRVHGLRLEDTLRRMNLAGFLSTWTTLAFGEAQLELDLNVLVELVPDLAIEAKP